MAGGSVHQVYLRAHFDVEAGGFGRVYLGEDDDVSTVDDAKVAGLAQFMGQPVHDRQRLGDEPLGGRMLLRQTKQTEGEVVALFVWGLGEVSTLLEAQDHSEYFGDSTIQPPSRLTYCQAFGCTCE